MTRRTRTESAKPVPVEHVEASPLPIVALPTDPSQRLVPVVAIKPWIRNPNKHSPASIRALADSIKLLGWSSVPTVRASDFRLISGHRRLAAAKVLGLTEVPCRVVDLTDEQCTALALRDQKMPDTDQDVDQLLALLREGVLLEDHGYGAAELEQLQALATGRKPKAASATGTGEVSPARLLRSTVDLHVFVGDVAPIEAAIELALSRGAATRADAVAVVCRAYTGSTP